MTGQVYFVGCAGKIKVGYSADANERVRMLATAAPTPLTLIGIVEGSRSLESAIHKKLKSHRSHREWFLDCPEVRALVDDVLARGSGAIEFVERPPKPVSVPPAAEPLELHWTAVAVKGLAALFDRFEYTILRLPNSDDRWAAFRALSSAHAEVDKMVSRSEAGGEAPDAEEKVKRWLAALENQLLALVSVRPAQV